MSFLIEHVQLHISEHETEDRHRRSTDAAVPSGFDLTLRLQERPITITLHRIDKAKVTSLPVHVLRNGDVVSEQLNHEEEVGPIPQHTPSGLKPFSIQRRIDVDVHDGVHYV